MWYGWFTLWHMTLVEFLLARIAEDDELARQAHEQKPYFRVMGWAYWDNDYGGYLLVNSANQSPAWMPSHVLAECDAKRRIVEGVKDVVDEWNDAYITGQFRASDVLRLLALPYSAHPDYSPGWKP